MTMGIFNDCLTNKDQGNKGLGKAIYELQFLGYRVSVPITENQKYDLVVEKDGSLFKLQIKTTKQKTKYGISTVGLRTLGGNRSFHTIKKREKGDYDLLYVLTNDNISYLIPENEIGDNSTTINLNNKYDKFIIKI